MWLTPNRHSAFPASGTGASLERNLVRSRLLLTRPASSPSLRLTQSLVVGMCSLQKQLRMSRLLQNPLSRTTTQEATAIRGASASLARPGSTTNSYAGSRRSPIQSRSSARRPSSQPRLKLSRARARPLHRTSSQEAMLTWRNCSRVAAERRPFAGSTTITSVQWRMKKKWR
jgi:hypothetical protein